MARAHRIHVPGQVWHLTHRCHHRRFLLKFARDRRLWRVWLYEARRRFGLCVLDYTVTSNHIHLIVRDRDQGEIAASMQLIEGCTGQAYNRRKRRGGAFWEDQYHATAVETGEHLARCVVYVDLNMVRAGVVPHPAEWEVGGYHEIQHGRARYRIVNREALAEALGVGVADLAAVHRDWVETGLRDGRGRRERQWTESVAVGSRGFVERVQRELGGRGRYRAIEQEGNGYVLREGTESYGRHSAGETTTLRQESAGSCI
jgi:putative transposase